MEEDLKKLLQENFRQNQEILETVKKINRYIVFQRIWGWTKICLILVPITLGFIYLPPIFSKYRQKVNEAVVDYQNLIGVTQEVDSLKQFLSR